MYLRERHNNDAVQVSPHPPQLGGVERPEMSYVKRNGPQYESVSVKQYPEDQPTIDSAKSIMSGSKMHLGNAEVKNEVYYHTQQQEKVRKSLTLRHREFPPPPRVNGSASHCQFCYSKFPTNQVQGDSWK